MAKPRIFISSTFFDLRQVRADLEKFIKEMGYESVRNETGAIPYGKDLKLEEYCYREISGIDILVGIIGGRFGSESKKQNYSVTQAEIKTALDQNKNVYLFLEKTVHSEYQTYLLNKDTKNIQYKYADDIRIYKFIEEIYSLPKNNVIHSFETAQDIIQFLREQWSGLLKDLLVQEHNRKEVESISNKVNELNEVANTLQTYLENVLQSVNKESSTELISKEKERLEHYQLTQKISKVPYIGHLIDTHNLTIDQVIESLKISSSLSELKHTLSKQTTLGNDGSPSSFGCVFRRGSLDDINKVRFIIGLDEYDLTDEEQSKIVDFSNIYDVRRVRRNKEKKKLPPKKTKKKL